MSKSIQEVFKGIDFKTYAAFQNYHKDNPWIWEYFKKYALDMTARRKSYGAKAIMERARYEYDIDNSTGEPFKINNDYTSLYARLFIYYFPQHENFFEFRTLTGLRRAA